MKKILTTLFILMCWQISFAQSSLLRSPALDSKAENIAFSYQGDIWVMNLQQQIPIRITIHEAYDASPTWSPDGKQLAFSSNRFGSQDVFVINKDGSGLKRLTYHASSDIVNSWTQQDRILFESRRISAQVERDQEIFAISPQGGNPTKVMDALGSYAIESPDGTKVAFVIGSCRIARQAYQGSANKNIWIFNKTDQSYKQLTSNSFNEFAPKWKNNNELIYISSMGGNTYQLVSQNIDNKEVEKLSNFNKFGLRHFSLAANANKAILERGGQVEMMDLTNGKINVLNIEIDIENRKNNIEHQTYTGNVSNYAVSPNGKYLVTEIKGNIFLSLSKDKDNITKTLTNDSYLNQQPNWLNDSTIIFISDKNGKNELYILSSSDDNESNLFKSLKLKEEAVYADEEDIYEIIVSNNKDQIAYRAGSGKLVVGDINEKGKLSHSKILLNTWAQPTGVCWSPDDVYLAYSKPDLDFNREIYIHKADNSEQPINVSMHPRTDMSPSWSPDGKKLAFSSIRNYGNYDIWYAWLEKKDYEKSLNQRQWESALEDKKDEKDSVVVNIDKENIYLRLTQLTSLPGNESNPIFSPKSDFIYFNSNSNENGKTDLYKIRWDKKEIKELTKKGTAGRGMSLSPDQKYLYLLKRGGKTGRLVIASDKMQNIPIKGKADWNYKEVRNQIFETAWKAIDQRFYDPNFHGKDWKELKKNYKEIAINASTDDDFRSIFNWMLGEINASHMGLYGPRGASVSKDKTSLIGIEFESLNKGIKISHVLPESPAAKEESLLMKGDIILKVNGEELSKKDNFYSHLVNQAKEAVLLSIERNGEPMEIVIRPTASLSTAKYNDWVSFNRNLVDELSDGQLGYLHIKAMGWASFERFERDIMAAGYGKKGILIDVRFNGGGWTTDYLMAVLNVKQYAYTVPRGAAKDLEKEHKNFREHYAYGERLPFASWTKPSIALCNQNSYSNAEIFSHAYKQNGLGTLVGVPTFGAVISTGGKSLMDGGYVRIPYRGWYVKATDENMELIPATPDVFINIKPDSRSKGKDEQLDKAVELLLKQIADK